MKHSNCKRFIRNFTKFSWHFFSHVEHNQNHVHLKIYDDDGAAGRDAIGSAKINLDHVKKSGNYDQWVKLPKRFGLGSNGQVHVRMTFHT
jgi:hypothetical protein